MKKIVNVTAINHKINTIARVILTNLNISKVVCDHLLDEKHTSVHRMIAGSFIMSVGVGISKIHVTMVFIHFLLDGVGYAIHGIGLIPFIETLSKHAQQLENKVVEKVESVETKEDESPH